MPLDFPVVPIQADAKVFALNDLHDAIKNLAVHQSTVGGGAGLKDTEGDKKRADAAAYRKILAELERRNAFNGGDQPTGPDESGFGSGSPQVSEGNVLPGSPSTGEVADLSPGPGSGGMFQLFE